MRQGEHRLRADGHQRQLRQGADGVSPVSGEAVLMPGIAEPAASARIRGSGPRLRCGLRNTPLYGPCRRSSSRPPCSAYSFSSPFISRFQPVHQPPRRPRLTFGQGVGRQQRQRHGRIEIAGHRVRQLLGIDLAPGHRLLRRGPAQAAGVGAGVGDLQEVVVAALVQAQHFLDLRLGLQDEVLGRAAAEDEDAAAAGLLGVVDEGRTLVDVAQRIDAAGPSLPAAGRPGSCRWSCRPATT